MAEPSSTKHIIGIVFIIVGILFFPALAILYWLDKKLRNVMTNYKTWEFWVITVGISVLGLILIIWGLIWAIKNKPKSKKSSN